MKKSICASIFMFCFSILAFAQASNSVCPEITISGPQGLIRSSESISFTANVKNADESLKLEFEWKVSLGMISEGQGTSSIIVSTTPEMAGSNLTATVKIKGISENCNNEASETVVMEALVIGEPFDSNYEKRSLDYELSKLDSYFFALQNSIGSRGYIYFGIEKGEDQKTVKNRISKLMNHFDFRKINRSLVMIDVCYSIEHHTILWIIPEGAELPNFGECEKVNINLK